MTSPSKKPTESHDVVHGLIGPLQLAILVVQNRHTGTQKSPWDKTNKGNYHLKLCTVCLLLVLPQCDFCVPACGFVPREWQAAVKPLIKSQDSIKKSIDEQQDATIAQLKKNQLALTRGLQRNRLALTSGLEKINETNLRLADMRELPGLEGDYEEPSASAHQQNLLHVITLKKILTMWI